jgi:hypothetical protein
MEGHCAHLDAIRGPTEERENRKERERKKEEGRKIGKK